MFGMVLDDRIEECVGLPNLLRPRSLGARVTEHEHDAVELSRRIEYRRRAVGDGRLCAVLGDQRGVVCKPDDLAVAQNSVDRIGRGFSRI